MHCTSQFIESNKEKNLLEVYVSQINLLPFLKIRSVYGMFCVVFDMEEFQEWL